MMIREIDNEKIWEDFVSCFNKKTFLVSWDWGEFRKKMGDKIFRRGVWDKDCLVAVFFVSKMKAKKGDFLMLTHNPLIKEYSDKILTEILNDLRETSRREKVSFLRIAPIWEKNSPEEKLLKKNGFINSSSPVFSEKSWELSLDKNEDDLLSDMRKNTRYMIRKTEKEKDFQITKSRNESDIDKFYDIYKKTSLRHGFSPFSLDYVEKEFSLFSKKDKALLFLAEKNGEYVAGAIIVFWQNLAFYHFGASMGGKDNLSASYLIQWEVIKEAKKRKCERYNFWVISPTDDLKHRWAGLTFFKKGFGGREINYATTKDLPLSWKYWLTRLFEKIKNLR